jgi:site-specific recombinase XerD
MYVIILKKYISWLNNNNHTDINLEGLKPIRISKSFSKQPLTEWEMKKLLGFHIRNIKDSRDKFMIKLLLATGLRLSEALSIKVSDVSYSNKKHYISITRKGKLQPISYAIPLSLYDAIRQWIETNKLKTNQHIIFSLPYKDQLNSNTATHIIKNRMRRAGINSVTKSAHSLRHTFATNLLKQGFSIYDVKAALGHASLKTTEIYTSQFDSYLTNKADYLNRLDKLITGSNYKVFPLLVR